MRIKAQQIDKIFKRLDQENIEYVALRGLNADGSAKAAEDIDLLIDLSKKNKYKVAIIFAANYSKLGIPIDLYSVCSTRGFLFKGYPYYPPLKAKEILRSRVFSGGAYILSREMEIKTLIYHLLYHKMPFKDYKSQKRLINQILAAAGNEFSLAQLSSSLFLESWLKKNSFNMPFDLKIRFTPNDLFNQLAQADLDMCNKPLVDSPDTCLFIRTDIYPAAYQQVLVEVRKSFRITHHFVLSDTVDRLEVARSCRGGNWYEGSHNKLIAPAIVIFVKFRPVLGGVSNFNELKAWKKLLRARIGAEINSKILGLHTSDSPTEALYALNVCCKLHEKN